MGGAGEQTEKISSSEFFRENVAEFDFQLTYHGFELVECDMAFPLFEQVQHSVRNTGFLGELSVRHFTPRFP